MATENKTTDLITNAADFELVFKSVTVKDGADDKPAVRVTASSTSIDLATDRFAKSALVQMASQFPQMTIFLNHKYNVPEDVFGKVSSAELVERDGYTDLDLEVDVETSNQRAVDTYNMIKSGTILGVSIGVLVLDADYVEDETTKGAKLLEITSVHTLEASVVGIPANRRSWVQGAIKAASALAGTVINKKADGTSLVALKNGGQVITVKTIEDETDPEVIAAAAAAAEPVEPGTPATPEVAAAAGDPATPAAPEVAAAAEDPEVTAAKKPAEDAADGGADDSQENPDGTPKKKPKGKAVKFASFDDIVTKAASMTGRAAARSLCDDMYGVVWTLWDAIYESFCDDGMEVEAKRGQAKALLAEFSTLCMRMVDNVIESYWGTDEAATEEQKAATVEAAKEFVATMKNYSEMVDAAKTGGSIKLAGFSLEDVTRLSHQSGVVIDKNRELAGELATKDAAHAVVVTEKDAVIHGLYECIDMLMEMPVARKTADTPQQDGGMAALEEQFPLLDKRIIANLAEQRVKRASALKQ